MVEGKENYLNVITPKEKARAEEKEEVEFLRKNRDLLVVRSHVKKLCNKYGFQMKVESIERLNIIVIRLVKEACLRARLNKRNTVCFRDY